MLVLVPLPIGWSDKLRNLEDGLGFLVRVRLLEMRTLADYWSKGFPRRQADDMLPATSVLTHLNADTVNHPSVYFRWTVGVLLLDSLLHASEGGTDRAGGRGRLPK